MTRIDEEKPADGSVQSSQEGIEKFRTWFRAAVDSAEDWQEEAREDYDFFEGRQWTETEKQAFFKSGRPAITINRIKPLMNVLSGYQRLNRYDIEFLPRTGDDVEICQVRKGMTKYVMDKCDYDSQESVAFMDAAIGGIGWISVTYKVDDETGDGEAVLERENPFGVYVDPEAHKDDFSDAGYICLAKWVDKGELSQMFPERKDEIEAQCAMYDSAELDTGRKDDNVIWCKKDLQKVRLVQCWYKEMVDKTYYRLRDGREIPQEEVTIEMFLAGEIDVSEPRTVRIPEVRVCAFFDRVLLEDMPSPYMHGEFPLVPVTCYYYGIDGGEIPAGFVRDLKDPQREINKRRIQMLHILDNASNGGGWIEQDAMTPEQMKEFEEFGTMPGHYQKVAPMALSGGKIREREMISPPMALIQAESQATRDMPAISGINEALMGVDIPSESSGRAIELKQKQAITHIAPMFDNLRRAKKRIAFLLWGRQGRPGIIPQFYTEDKVYRIEGRNGQQFIPVNHPVVVGQDPIAGPIIATMNDLSQGDFDIVVSDTQASTTQRQAQLWGLVDAVQKLQVPGDLVFDIILDLSDIPNKEEIKQRWQERQQQNAQAMQQQMELERIKNENMHQSISFKDAPLPIQLGMAAKQGILDPQIAQYSINLWIQQMYPRLAEAMANNAQQAQQMQQMQGAQGEPPQDVPPEIQQMASSPQMQFQTVRNYQPRVTQAAARSILAGQAPAAL